MGRFLKLNSLKALLCPIALLLLRRMRFRAALLTKINLPENIDFIGTGAFSDCGSLTKITLPGSLTKLASAVFARCTALQEVYVNAKLISISARAFIECENLTK